MATTIKLKNSVTTTNAPSSLVQGEVAINVTDKKVWVGNAATTPVQLLGAGADGSFTNISVSGVASFADGTVSLPAITNIGDTNTGIFFPAADTIAFAEGGVESMRIDSSGNLGVGTTNPAVKFQVSSSTAADGAIARLELTNTSVFGGDKYGQLQFFGNDSSSTASGIRAYVNGDATGSNGEAAIVFGTANTNAAVAERMRIDSAGNVGIGTSSPTGKFNVTGSVGSFYVDAGATGIAFTYNGGNYISAKGGSSGALVFETGGANERMRIGSVGEVLIGSTSTASKLQVSGNSGSTIAAINNFSNGQAYLSTNTAAAGTGWFHFNGVSNNNTVQNILILGNGNIQNANNSYGTFSDIKLKENIVDTTPKLDDVLKLKVRNFNLIGEQENNKQIGFVAQELEEVFPKLVDESIGIDGLPVKGVKTSVLIPILVKAIQEQQAIITDLKARIETLESK